MKIFCSGIGGIGLSAYASLQAAAGHAVAGSDRKDSPLLADLRSQGITIHLAQDGSAIAPDTDLFVFSEAIPKEAPERMKAAGLGIPAQSYFQALGEISRDARVIAVCGTHGKSSTTAMAAKLLVEAGKDPRVVVGTKVPELGGRNWRVGKGREFILEACEYRRSFHFLSPSIALMTNVDGDHFDAFGSLEEYQEAFVEFLKRLPENGIVITHLRDADCARVAQASGRKVIDADAFPEVTLRVPGAHMRENAKLVLALADVLGIPQEEAARILSTFAGTWRRMEVKGEWKGVTVIDDYGHHPKEIRATLSAMREAYSKRRIVLAFQPHTHDRTLKLYDEFLSAFTDADIVIVPNIYNARSDIETAAVDLTALLTDIEKGSDVRTIDGKSLEETERLLKEELLKPGDVLVCMGAGDITELASRFAPA